MINDHYKGVLKNTAQISYSYDNTEQIVTKCSVSNTTLVKIRRYDYYDDSIESILDLSELDLDHYQLANLCIKGDANLHDSYIVYCSNKRYLIIKISLNLSVYYDEDTCICNKHIDYFEKYEYKIPIDKCEVNEISINISNIRYDILRRDKIKIITYMEFGI